MKLRFRLFRLAGITTALGSLGVAFGRPSLADEVSAAASAEDLALVRADEAARVAVFDRARRAVVCIFADNRRTGGGSGVIFDERGYGLTNFHVVAEFVETRRGVGGLSDGNLYPLTVLGLDPGGDIALFKLEGKPRFDAAPLADSDRLVVGQWAAAMGNPFLLAEDYFPTITLGIISGLHRYQAGQENALEYADCIQVSSSINPGNSGGPLFDLAGRLIGINGRGSFEERGRVNVGLGYAVSVNQIKRFIPSLRAGRLCEHGTLGATVALAGADLIFDAVQQSAPAATAGVLLGDALLSVNGRPMRTPNDYNNIMATLPADWPVRLSLRREGQLLDLIARTERLPIRKLPTFILDLRHNHAELRLLLDAARSVLLPNDRGCTEFAWRGWTYAGNAVPQTVEVLHDEAGLLSVWSANRETELFTATDAPDADSQPALWREWRLLMAPLLFPVPFAVGWELIGGDELGGRIVSVVERRLETRERIRWFFDAETTELLEVTFESDGGGRVIWRPERPADAAQPLARTWVRYGSDDVSLVTVESVQPAGAAPGSGSEEQ